LTVIGIVRADKKMAEVVIIRSDNNLGFSGFFASGKNENDRSDEITVELSKWPIKLKIAFIKWIIRLFSNQIKGADN
jgi:hypothetical protein